MSTKTVLRGLFLLLAVAGCPTRTIYYDAGADRVGLDEAGTSGRGSGGAGTAGLTGAGANALAGSGGGGAAGQQGIAGAGGGATAGAAGESGVAGSAGGFGASGGAAGGQGTAGVGGGGVNSCVDTTADPKNCGVCGHDCLGGICSAGQCQPVMLAQYTGEADLIDVGATSVYVSTDLGYIGRAAKDGSDLKPPQMPSFVTSAHIGTHAIEDGDRVFFIWRGNSSYEVSFCSSQSCEPSIMPVGGAGSQYFAVDTADHRIAWIDYSPTRILVGPTTGAITGTQIIGTDSSWSEQPLYYAAGGLFILAGDGTIQRLPLSGGTFRTVASGAGTGSITILGDNGTTLFFYDGASIRFTPLPAGDGLTGQTLIDTVYARGSGRRFAVDSQAAYWVSSGKIHTCQLSQCNATEQIVASQASVQVEDVGIDQNALYWVNEMDGTVPGSGLAYFSVWKLAR